MKLYVRNFLLPVAAMSTTLFLVTGAYLTAAGMAATSLVLCLVFSK